MFSFFAIKHPSSKGEKAPETNSRLAGLTMSPCCVAAGDGGLSPTDKALVSVCITFIWSGTFSVLLPPALTQPEVVVVERQDRSTSEHVLAPSGT